MAKKKKIDTSNLENLAIQIYGLTGMLEDELKPLMNLNDLGKHINNLKKEVNKSKEYTNGTTTTEDEGETCMHDNSWHSECSECNELNSIDDLFKLVEDTPNDKELGKKIRQIYWAYTNSDASS